MKEGATPPPMDFFNRIVLKARGAESSIEPRLPSLFEPVAGVAMAPMTAIEEQVVAARDPQDAPPKSMASRGPVTHASRPLAPRPVETRVPGEALDPVEPDREGRSAQTVPVATLQPVPAVTPLRVHLAARLDEQQPDGTPEFDILRTDRSGARRTRASDRDGSAARPEALRHESGLLIPKPAAVSMPYHAAGEAPRADAPAAHNVAATVPMAEQPAPVIHVTIGRVEVRAVPAPAGKPRVDPSKPKPLSLDDYLKRRGGNR